jgi:thioredoxin reductase
MWFAAMAPKSSRKLDEHNIPVRSEPIHALEGTNGKLTKIKFENGPDLPRAGLFFSTGCHQTSDLSKRLGCQRDTKGGVLMDANTEETTVPGVYVAGRVARRPSGCSSHRGRSAGGRCNKAFLRRDGFCD